MLAVQGFVRKRKWLNQILEPALSASATISKRQIDRGGSSDKPKDPE